MRKMEWNGKNECGIREVRGRQHGRKWNEPIFGQKWRNGEHWKMSKCNRKEVNFGWKLNKYVNMAKWKMGGNNHGGGPNEIHVQICFFCLIISIQFINFGCRTNFQSSSSLAVYPVAKSFECSLFRLSLCPERRPTNCHRVSVQPPLKILRIKFSNGVNKNLLFQFLQQCAFLLQNFAIFLLLCIHLK